MVVRTSSHVWKAGEEEGEEEVEDDQIADEDGGHEVGDARTARHKDAVPHRFYPLPAQHAEHDHEAKHRQHGHDAVQIECLFVTGKYEGLKTVYSEFRV